MQDISLKNCFLFSSLDDVGKSYSLEKKALFRTFLAKRI